jgi:hypothetical protein
VRTLPAVSSLRSRYAGAHIAWLVEPAAASAVEAQPWIDEVLVFPRDTLVTALRAHRPFAAMAELSRFLRRLRERRFDLALDFHALLRSGALARASGAERRVSYARPFAREGPHTESGESLRAKRGARAISRDPRDPVGCAVDRAACGSRPDLRVPCRRRIAGGPPPGVERRHCPQALRRGRVRKGGPGAGRPLRRSDDRHLGTGPGRSRRRPRCRRGLLGRGAPCSAHPDPFRPGGASTWPSTSMRCSDREPSRARAARSAG